MCVLLEIGKGCLIFFFFNETSTTEFYTYWHTLSLHDALPICSRAARWCRSRRWRSCTAAAASSASPSSSRRRSEEHTSELQSLMRISYAVFCLKKKKTVPSILNNISSYNASVVEKIVS